MTTMPVPLARVAEMRVDGLPAQVALRIPMFVADALLDAGGYEADVGLRRGHHYRKARGRTGCYHLTIDGAHASLHWDRWDPRRHPIEHGIETPEIRAVATVGLASLLVRAAIGGLTSRFRPQARRKRR